MKFQTSKLGLDQITLIPFTTSLLNLVIGTNLCHQIPPPRPYHPERRDALWWLCSEPPPQTRCKNSPYTTHLPENKQNWSQFFFWPYNVHPRKQILFNMYYSPIVSAATDQSNIFFSQEFKQHFFTNCSVWIYYLLILQWYFICSQGKKQIRNIEGGYHGMVLSQLYPKVNFH